MFMLRSHPKDAILSLKGQESAVDNLIMLSEWPGLLSWWTKEIPEVSVSQKGKRLRKRSENWHTWICILRFVRFLRNLKLLYLYYIKRFVLAIIWDIRIFCYTSHNIDENAQLHVVFSFSSMEGVLSMFIEMLSFPDSWYPHLNILYIFQFAYIMSYFLCKFIFIYYFLPTFYISINIDWNFIHRIQV